MQLPRSLFDVCLIAGLHPVGYLEVAADTVRGTTREMGLWCVTFPVFAGDGRQTAIYATDQTCS
jgi:hypothetical protein